MNTAHHYQPTIIESALLFKRLTIQFAFLKNELKRSWPQFTKEFKNDPVNFTKHLAHRFARVLKNTATRGYALAASASAVTALAFMLTIVWLVNSSTPKLNNAADGPSLQVTLLEFAAPPDIKIDDDNKGTGRLQKSSLGGGGNRDPLPPQHGELPPPSPIPAAIPITPPLYKQSLPVAGIDIDPTQWQDVKAVVYGDPNSTSTIPSAGPGSDNGIGTGKGPGIGSGSESGYGCNGGDLESGWGRAACGHGRDQTYKGSEVEQRARLLQKPEPQYTEEARKNQITGTVMLRAVFSSGGEVVQIQAIRSLPFGLTERAIAAARQIKFVPAMKDGRPVSVFMQLEYNFNLY
ncbi:MAG TPA: energy transducer TonB [Pyrinomonadaceae bacterium]|nr:energy transducer TonB [Pyrinomonadaceae bacterium]